VAAFHLQCEFQRIARRRVIVDDQIVACVNLECLVVAARSHTRHQAERMLDAP
jgi:hypothetical protein